MSEDNDCGEDADGGERQPLQAREDDHGRADDPYDLEDGHADIEGPAEADESDLDEDEPEASLNEKAGKLGSGFTLTLQIDAGAGEKDEAGSTDVGDPAGDKESRPGVDRIGWVDWRTGEVVAGVVEGHDDHE